MVISTNPNTGHFPQPHISAPYNGYDVPVHYPAQQLPGQPGIYPPAYQQGPPGQNGLFIKYFNQTFRKRVITRNVESYLSQRS